MVLGMDFPQSWKEKSSKENIPLADLLYGYALEDLLLRIETSSFYKYLWLTNEEALGEAAYRKVAKPCLEYVYVESKKEKAGAAGAPFAEGLLELFLEEIQKMEGMSWQVKLGPVTNEASLFFQGTYNGMTIPVTLHIRCAKLSGQSPKEKELPCLFEKRKTCHYFSYSKEDILAEALFEIMRKLELISDMQAYGQVNHILKNQTVSGRHVLEAWKQMAEKEPKVATIKRLEQVKTYVHYGYMKKKWQQYARNHASDSEEWEEIMERILKFLSPTWKALCDNEIFFDDWMPELERFLG